jgi:hypothetical protein
MSYLNYLKLDLRLLKNIGVTTLILPILFVVFFIKTNPIMALSYVNFFILVFAVVPFNVESNQKCIKLFYSLPSKTSNMVLGRFLYFLVMLLCVWIIIGISIFTLYSKGTLTFNTIIILCLSCLITPLLCFIQYPVYYKFGVEKGKIVAMLVYILPAVLIFMIPPILSDGDILKSQFITNIITFFMKSNVILVIMALLIIFLLGFISYLVSCSICDKKEI